MTRDVLLLSIRPEYADKIFAGTKRVELRRVRPNVRPGDCILVYVSSPVQALMGRLEVERVVAATPAELWGTVRDLAGVTREQFEDYFAGADKAYGIFVREVRRLPKPVRLNFLRRLFTGFHPPQSYRYVTQIEAAAINLQSHEIMRRDLLQKMPASVRG